MQTSDPESDMADILELYQTGHLKWLRLIC